MWYSLASKSWASCLSLQSSGVIHMYHLIHFFPFQLWTHRDLSVCPYLQSVLGLKMYSTMSGLIFSPALLETRCKTGAIFSVHLPLRFWLIYRYHSLIVIYLLMRWSCLSISYHPSLPTVFPRCSLRHSPSLMWFPKVSASGCIFWRGLSPRSWSLCVLALEGHSVCYVKVIYLIMDCKELTF